MIVLSVSRYLILLISVKQSKLVNDVINILPDLGKENSPVGPRMLLSWNVTLFFSVKWTLNDLEWSPSDGKGESAWPRATWTVWESGYWRGCVFIVNHLVQPLINPCVWKPLDPPLTCALFRMMSCVCLGVCICLDIFWGLHCSLGRAKYTRDELKVMLKYLVLINCFDHYPIWFLILNRNLPDDNSRCCVKNLDGYTWK